MQFSRKVNDSILIIIIGIMIGLPRIYSKKSVGEIELRGKNEDIKLFEIIDNEGEN